MASRMCSDFEQNLHAPGMTWAIKHAIASGQKHTRLTPALVRKFHQIITGHTLGENSYRSCEVTFGNFKPHEIIHASHVPFAMHQLCRDIHGLLAEGKDTNELITLETTRLVRMQPFQDANKRTSMALADYILAYRGENEILFPRHYDAPDFVDAIYNDNQEMMLALICAWRRAI